MGTARVLIGRDNAGVQTIRTSLPGYDVLTDDPNDLDKMSFDANWADMVRVHQVGLASLGVFPNSATIPYSPLSHVPFIEVKSFINGRYYNDWSVLPAGNNFLQTAQFAFEINASSFKGIWISGWNPSPIAFYVIYKFGFVGALT